MSSTFSFLFLLMLLSLHYQSCFLFVLIILTFIIFSDDEPTTYRPSSPQLPIKNMGFNTMGDSRVNQSSKKMSRHKSRRNNERQPKQPKDTNSLVENGPNDDSCRQIISDEDYKVFCFRDDGAFNIIKDGKPKTSNCFDYTPRSSPRPVNRKVSNNVVYILNWDRKSKIRSKKKNTFIHVLLYFALDKQLNYGEEAKTNGGDIMVFDQKVYIWCIFSIEFSVKKCL
jgi:hypothetical protein